VFAGSTIQRDHPDDWIYDLDLHLELDTDELLIKLVYPIAGFNFPLYVDHLRISGPSNLLRSSFPLRAPSCRLCTMHSSLCGYV
jgi:hypothetical protein